MGSGPYFGKTRSFTGYVNPPFSWFGASVEGLKLLISNGYSQRSKHMERRQVVGLAIGAAVGAVIGGILGVVLLGNQGLDIGVGGAIGAAIGGVLTLRRGDAR